jgi:hypothetical protein
MSACPDGSRSHTNAIGRLSYIVVHLPQPPKAAYSQDDIIRSHLGNGRCVLVRGQALNGPQSFTTEEVEAYKGSIAQTVEWQGKWHFLTFCNKPPFCIADARKRSKEFHTNSADQPQIHSTSTLQEFMEAAHDPAICGNLLDMKAMCASIPAVIWLVSALQSLRSHG